MTDIVVETGEGLEDATSYASLEEITEAVDLFSDASTSAAWNALSEEQQLNAARQSALYLDRTYLTRWKGTRKTMEQGLDWPRYNVYDNDGWPISPNEVPKKLLLAQAILCGKSAIGEDLDVDQDASLVQSESVSAGPVSRSVTYSGSKRSGKRFTSVDQVLASLLISGSGSVSLGPAYRG